MSFETLSRQELIETAKAIREQERRIERERQEGSLLEFVRYFWFILEPGRDFLEGEAIEAMCLHLEAVADGEINRMLMNVSPGFMKSLLLNVFFPAWLWGPKNRPNARILSFSYAAHLTERDNAKFRDLVKSPEYRDLWGDRFSLVEDGKIKVSNSETGFKFASSVGGVGTGERGDFVFLDDPHNVKESESDPVRTETNRWFREALQNRLNDLKRSSIIVIMQRVHEEDVSGVILSEYPEYVHLCIPMEYDATRHCRTVIGWEDWRSEDGELAWPERFPYEDLAPFRRLPFMWAGQYQQSPTPRGGGIIRREWWRVWDDAEATAQGVGNGAFPPVEFVLASLDTAYTEKQENDPSALTVWGLWRDRGENPKLILMNAWAKRLELHGADMERLAGETEYQWRERTKPNWGLIEWTAHTCKRFRVDLLLIEGKASGISVSQELRRLHRHDGFGVRLIDPGRADKVARAYAVQALFADGLIYAPDRSWADQVITQFESFPKAKHDDLVDSSTQAINFFRTSGMLQRGAEIAADFGARALHTGKPTGPVYDV